MYRWKCWHDSRDRVALYGTAGFVVTALTGLDIWGVYHRQEAMFAAYIILHRYYWWNPSLGDWFWGMNSLAELMLPAAIWLALVFGFKSVGREYGSGAMAFVLTRPQKRWRIVWDEWALAVAEICLVLSMLVIGMTPFLFMVNKIYVSFSGLILPGALAMAACLYGLTQFLTLLTGSSGKGLSATIAVVLFYYFLPGALNDWWHIGWPLKVTSMSLSLFDMDWSELPLAFWEISLLWAMVALIFPFLSQWLIERREV